MLTELWVSNLAVLEDVRAEFGSGLTAITGETGAGKSLLVGAVDLALGARASADMVRQGASSAEVVARFDLPADHFTARGLEQPLDEGALLVRRVIGSDGRSRAYVNDRPATVGRLRELGATLADLHGQHEQQNLLREETHLQYLDAFLDLDAAGTAAAYGALTGARDAREVFLARARQGAEERERLRFQLEELEAAELRDGELEELEAERHRAAHAGRLAETAGESLRLLSEEDGNVAAVLARVSRLLDQGVGLDPSLEPLRHMLDESMVAAEEAARGLAAYLESLDADPERLEAIEARLDRIHRLRRKYHEDVSGLLARQESLRRELEAQEDAPRVLQDLEAAVAAAEARLEREAAALSAARSRGAATLGRQVTRELGGLGMDGARFLVELAPPRQGLPLPGRKTPVGPRGAEDAGFTLAANPGEGYGPLSRIASGGEVSRVMLALKNVLRRTDPVPLAIFDEVDAGIGGLVAEAVAVRLTSISRTRQVLVVTHLGVIAGRADRHLRVVKQLVGGRTRIAVEALDGKAREEEIARMMAGSVGGDSARRTARSILAERKRS